MCKWMGKASLGFQHIQADIRVHVLGEFSFQQSEGSIGSVIGDEATTNKGDKI